MNFWETLKQPWPWYVAGPIIGLMIPALLILGNKSFGISASLRHICAACIPAKIPFFQYNWRNELWNLFLVAGILAGGVIAMSLLSNHQAVRVNAELITELKQYGIYDLEKVIPSEIVNWRELFSAKAIFFTVGGGFLVGFGTRYAGGCTSGHSIMGLANLQWPSLIATVCFMVGGILVANYLLPVILKL